MRVVPSALIIGTFAPDFEYFLRLAPSGGFGHSIFGVFILTLPLALLILWLFHAFVKTAATRLLPNPIQRRLTAHLQPFPWRGTTRFLAIIGSLLLGIATHIVWDSFTHPTSWLYRHWSFLHQTVDLPLIGRTPYYKAFQHGSTLLGILVLLLWFAAWYRNSKSSAYVSELPPPAVPGRIIISMFLAIALFGSAVRVIAFKGATAHVWTTTIFTGQAVCTFIALLWWEFVAYGWYESSRHRSLARTKIE